MTVHTIRRFGAWAYVEPAVYEDPDIREGIYVGLSTKAETAIPDGMRVLHSVPVRREAHRRILAQDQDPHPDHGLPYPEGDIIPEGYRPLWLLTVSVPAYDPQENDG